MRALLSLLLIALAPRAQAQNPSFDLGTWIGAADALARDTVWDEGEDPFARSAPLAEALDAAIHWSAGCFEAGRPGDRPPGWGSVGVDWLGPDEALVALGCSLAAYQGSSVAVRAVREDGAWSARLLAFPLFVPADGEYPERISATTHLVMWESTDPAARTLTTFNKARGLGDCGVWTVYGLEDFGEPYLIEVRSRACDDESGTDPGEPDTWPVVYPRAE